MKKIEVGVWVAILPPRLICDMKKPRSFKLESLSARILRLNRDGVDVTIEKAAYDALKKASSSK